MVYSSALVLGCLLSLSCLQEKKSHPGSLWRKYWVVVYTCQISRFYMYLFIRFFQHEVTETLFKTNCIGFD
jgi:hypothetical protein